MKGEKFTADHPTPKPGKRTTAMGTPIPDDFFENETDKVAVLKSEKISEKISEKHVHRRLFLGDLLDVDDSAFDALGY